MITKHDQIMRETDVIIENNKPLFVKGELEAESDTCAMRLLQDPTWPQDTNEKRTRFEKTINERREIKRFRFD